MRSCITVLLFSLICASCNADDKSTKETPVDAPKDEEISLKKIVKTDKEWRKLLTRQQYRITRKADTERAYTGEYLNSKEKGTYNCVACDLPLFSSETKYDSRTGWPSFWKPIDDRYVGSKIDRSWGKSRGEVVCNRCDAHLGHLFEDGPKPTGLRYCINSGSLRLEAAKK